jgi:DNA-binding response OmpR family regulator
VEDDPMIGDSLRRGLRGEGFTVEVIAKFQKAQDFFSEAEDKKEVLVCKIR